jgi:hypothetical protein
MNFSRVYKIGLLTCFLGSVYCCSPSLLRPTQSDEAFAKDKWGQAGADLNQGYDIYVSKCGGCHILPKPLDYSEEKWMEILPDMCKRAFLNKAQQESVTRYVLTKRLNKPDPDVKK